MADTNNEFSKTTFPWARTGFDLEGIAGALASWLIGILLGMIWGPLFWLGFIAAVICLLATRRAGRTMPEAPDAVVAPCDGVITEITTETPPTELRMKNVARTRIRVSSSPASPTGIYAPMAGGIEAIVREEGDPSRVVALSADALGLSVAFVTIASGDSDAGLRIAAAGLGPRIDIDVEAADAVRAGRQLGKRRMGGWCDIYLPVGFRSSLVPGMTLVGGETSLGTWSEERLDVEVVPAILDEIATEAAEIKDEPDENTEISEEVEADTEVEVDTETGTEAETESSPEPKADAEPATDAEEDEEDPSEMFAKLRREAEKASSND
ncbi:MAG: phosphatidylserine decarboxylase [Pseudomonadota bacterium]